MPFWKCVLPTKHCSILYSRLTINPLNHFRCFCGITTGFPAKTNRCALFNCFFHYDLWYAQSRQVTSHLKYVSHCEWFELKLGICGEEGLLTNFPKFHLDRTTSAMFLQHCHKTYRTDLIIYIFVFNLTAWQTPQVRTGLYSCNCPKTFWSQNFVDIVFASSALFSNPFPYSAKKIFRNLEWEGKGLNLNGKHLTNLRFADNIALVSESLKELTIMMGRVSCTKYKSWPLNSCTKNKNPIKMLTKKL